MKRTAYQMLLAAPAAGTSSGELSIADPPLSFR
jgi:hypothetical protein